MNNQLEKLILTESETLTEVVNCLAKHITINSTGAGNPQSLFKVLVRAASKQDTIENTSKELKKVTCGNNIRAPRKIQTTLIGSVSEAIFLKSGRERKFIAHLSVN